jgi:hypothetical protein
MFCAGSIIHLLEAGLWKHPGEDVLHDVVPWITDPLVFLPSIDQIERESRGYLADYPVSSKHMRELRGSLQALPVELPWRDVERSILVAVNRNVGDDVAIALDFRTSQSDPRVIASAWREDGLFWEEVAPTFTQFLRAIPVDIGALPER